MKGDAFLNLSDSIRENEEITEEKDETKKFKSARASYISDYSCTGRDKDFSNVSGTLLP